MQARAVAAVREHDRSLAEANDGDVLWLACTHGDVIKAIVADALGTHLDSFQRITADTGIDECDPLHNAAPLRGSREPHR